MTSSSNRGDGNDFSGQILDWVKKQGYPLEMAVADVFRDAGFDISLSDWYKDFETGEQREIDVTASYWVMNNDPTSSHIPASLQICWSIECKLSRDKPWLVFISEAGKQSYFPPFSIASSAGCRGILFRIWQRTLFQEKCLPLLSPKQLGHGVTQAFTTGYDIAYKAIMSSVKASVGQINLVDGLSKITNLEEPNFWCIAFPTVVIDGKLFECHISKDEAICLDEVEMSTVLWKSPTPVSASSNVYIVTKPAIDKFALQAKEMTISLIEKMGMEHRVNPRVPEKMDTF